MSIDVKKYLDLLEGAIEPEFEEEKLKSWKNFLHFEEYKPYFGVEMGQDSVSDWPAVSINKALSSPELMLIAELRQCYKCCTQRLNQIMNIRPNYGTSILSSVFGADLFVMDEELNTLPAARSIGKKGVSEVLAAGEPDINAGQGRQVFETTDYYCQVMKDYPKIQKYVNIYHPDLQGPINICELLWGSEIFLDFHDRPKMIDDMLSLVTETYLKFLRKWYSLAGMNDEVYSTHWGYLQKGHTLIRNDSLMNLSPELYRDKIKRYDQQILKEFGGGIHFCGRADHCISDMVKLENISWIQLSQPSYNDMEKVVTETTSAGLNLIISEYAGTALPKADISRAVAYWV